MAKMACRKTWLGVMVLIPTFINAISPYYHSIRGASEGLVEGGAGADYNNNGIYFFMEVTNKHT
jgi:hypothetical protein